MIGAWWRVLFFSVAVVFGGAIAKAEICGEQDGYDWRMTVSSCGGYTTAWHSDPTAAVQEMAEWRLAHCGWQSVTSVSYEPPGTGGCPTGRGRIEYLNASGNPLVAADCMGQRSSTIEPAACPSCDEFAQPNSVGIYPSVSVRHAVGSPAATVCNEIPGAGQNCTLKYAGGPCIAVPGTPAGMCLSDYRYTGAGCGTPTDPPPEVLPPDVGGLCVSSAAGQVCLPKKTKTNCGTVNGEQVCMDAPTNCGTVNGEYQCLSNAVNCGTVNGEEVCVGKVPQSQCVTLQGGQVICGASAVSPPAPDNGTPGTVAEPDAVITGNTVNSNNTTSTTTTNVYGSAAVGASSVPPETVVPVGGDLGLDGDGVGEGDTGSVSGGEGCDAPPSCDGDVLQCALIQQMWKARCVVVGTASEIIADMTGGDEVPQGLPTAEAVDVNGEGGFSDDRFGGGASNCPAPISVTVMGQAYEIPYTHFCQLAAWLHPVVILAAGLAALGIVFRGGGHES